MSNEQTNESIENGVGYNDDDAKVQNELEEDHDEEIITALPTIELETKLRHLRDQSNKHSQALTQKLATSQSGQNLLHIGSSLSTLPPDLHSLLTQLHPIVSAAESMEKQHLQHLQTLVACGNDIRAEMRKAQHAQQCAILLEDLVAGEADLKRDEKIRKRNVLQSANALEKENQHSMDELDHVASLERSAFTAVSLVQDLQISSEQVSALTSKLAAGDKLPSLRTPLENDTERAQFVMKLAPRIRRLESDAITCLSARLEIVLKRIQHHKEHTNGDADKSKEEQDKDLLMIGHCLRGLALLGKGQEAENVFARVAIMPLIRSKLSMGRLDEGGSRGACAGLPNLLEDISISIASSFGPVLQLAESMFEESNEVDLVTAGVWIPIATALMADAGIKMAIFSPGIASILQSNYVALDGFLSGIAARLLKDTNQSKKKQPRTGIAALYYDPFITPAGIQKAQTRIMAHPKTAEFSKRWNLPIYYQLRFGDYCTRLNKAFERTRKEGWFADVFSQSEIEQERIRKETGFELSLFIEVFAVLSSFWNSDVFLRPLTHRFVRGAVQIIGRTTSFVSDGLNGKLQFGEEKKPEPPKEPTENASPETNGDFVLHEFDRPTTVVKDPYYWHESLNEVAAVAWDLNVLEARLSRNFIEAACKAAAGDNASDKKQVEELVKDVLSEATSHISPLVLQAWNEVIVGILINKCSGPLAGVKGVAATYRMTSRPPPTRPSNYVHKILKPLTEFNKEFRHKTPLQVGIDWKIEVVANIAQKYCSAVEELIATVQRTEAALRTRGRLRKRTSGGMSDGDKVKLQLFLDFKEFSKNVQEVGVDPLTIESISKLQELTNEAQPQSQNGSSM